MARLRSIVNLNDQLNMEKCPHYNKHYCIAIPWILKSRYILRQRLIERHSIFATPNHPEYNNVNSVKDNDVPEFVNIGSLDT